MRSSPPLRENRIERRSASAAAKHDGIATTLGLIQHVSELSQQRFRCHLIQLSRPAIRLTFSSMTDMSIMPLLHATSCQSDLEVLIGIT